MSVGIIFALIGVIFIGIMTTASKYVSGKYGNFYNLFWQYVWMTLAAYILLTITSTLNGSSIWPEWTMKSLGVLTLVGIFGFAGIFFLYKAFEKLAGGIALTIANLTIFFQYFANVSLFDSGEQLSWIKIILAIIFFVIVSRFMIDRSSLEGAGTRFNKHSIYPILTAICRGIFYVGNAYFIKNNILNPEQTLFYTEATIFIFAIIAFAAVYKGDFSKIKKTTISQLWPFALIGITNVTGQFLLYTALLDTPANIVNVIRLFAIITTAGFCYIFLKETLTKRQLILITLAFLVLAGFLST